MNPNPIDPLLTLDDVTRLLQCSKRTIQRQLDAGKFPVPIRLGRLRRWRQEDIETWLASGGKPPRSTRTRHR